MAPLPQDEAGELGRYITHLKNKSQEVRERLQKVRADIRAERFEAELLAQLTAEEQAAIQDFLEKKNLAELISARDLLVAQRDALEKAVLLLRAKLEAVSP